MKRLFTIFCCMFLWMLSMEADNTDKLIENIRHELSEKMYDQATSTFCILMDKNSDRAELFYWTEIDKNNPVAQRFIHIIAAKYGEQHNYEKAAAAYIECLKFTPNDVSVLSSCAEMFFMLGNEDQAQRYYLQIIRIDKTNLKANIFLGNYYYWKGENQRKYFATLYHINGAPNTMDKASYRTELKNIYQQYYSKAIPYYTIVMQFLPSTEVESALKQIAAFQAEM